MEVWITVLCVAILSLSRVAAQSSTIGGLSGSHTNIPRWCGKPYKAGSPDFPPGGMLHPPVPSPTPMLLVQVEPRHSIYDSNEAKGEFIVEVSTSNTHGEPYRNETAILGSNVPAPINRLDFDIRIEETNELLVSSGVFINSNARLFQFELRALKPRLEPYNIILYGAPMHEIGYQNYTAMTQLYYLPAKNSGSTVKIDNLNGGMLVANHVTNYDFELLLPFGFCKQIDEQRPSLSLRHPWFCDGTE